MTRDLSEYEQAALKQQTCPFCGGDFSKFEVRARGGLSTNYYCPCGAGFNLASFQGKYVLAELIAEPETHPSPLCPFATQDECWDDQEARADPLFVCPVHGQAHDTLGRLGVDVL